MQKHGKSLSFCWNPPVTLVGAMGFRSWVCSFAGQCQGVRVGLGSYPWTDLPGMRTVTAVLWAGLQVVPSHAVPSETGTAIVHWSLAGWDLPGPPAAAQELPPAGDKPAPLLPVSPCCALLRPTAMRIPMQAGERGCSLPAASGGENLETKQEKNQTLQDQFWPTIRNMQQIWEGRVSLLANKILP